MYLQRLTHQSRKPEACDYCADPEGANDQTPKPVQAYNVFPYGVFTLCQPHATELAKS